MQTDPNFTNFLWNSKTQQVCIVLAQRNLPFLVALLYWTALLSNIAAISSGLWRDT